MHTFPIVGMHCAGCAQNIERQVKIIPEVVSVSVNYSVDQMVVELKKTTKDVIDKLSKAVSSVGNYHLVTDSAHDDMADMRHQHQQHSHQHEHSTHQHDMSQNHSHHSVHTSHDHGAALKEEEYRQLKSKVIISVIITIPIMIGAISGIMPPIFQFILASVVLFWAGSQFFTATWAGLKNFQANMDTLVALGTTSAWLYSTINTFATHTSIFNFQFSTNEVYFDAAAVITTLILLGRLLEARAKGNAQEAIKGLAKIAAKTALVIRDKKEVEIPVEELLVGDMVIVKPGNKIPTDGKIIDGTANIDESMVTGESIPVTKTVGDKVIGATINRDGSLKVKVTAVGSDTFLSQISKFVSATQASKAPIQRLADTVSSYFVPAVIIIAIITFITWLSLGQPFSLALTLAVTVLIISCPCALGLATPVAVMVGSGLGANHGILIKDAKGLEMLSKVDTFVVDKTGTLTQGKPVVKEIRGVHDNSEEALTRFQALAAAVENKSEHPLAQAVVIWAKEKAILDKNFVKLQSRMTVTDFKVHVGRGVVGRVNGMRVAVGKPELMTSLGLDTTYLSDDIKELESAGDTVVLLSVEGSIEGLIAMRDAIKPTATDTIRWLTSQNKEVWMITGDNQRTAKAIAKEAGIKNILAGVLPKDKAKKIKELQDKDGLVAMIGDGINDAPALAQSDVGIAMGTGTDIAIDSSDITLVGEQFDLLKKAIHLSRSTMSIIRQNLFWAFGYNIILIPIAAGVLYLSSGILVNPMLASGAMAFSSLSVVLNSLRLKRVKLV